jgi:hypothetical protein
MEPSEITKVLLQAGRSQKKVELISSPLGVVGELEPDEPQEKTIFLPSGSRHFVEDQTEFEGVQFFEDGTEETTIVTPSLYLSARILEE